MDPCYRWQLSWQSQMLHGARFSLRSARFSKMYHFDMMLASIPTCLQRIQSAPFAFRIFFWNPSTLWHRGSHLCALHTQWGGGVYSGVLHLLCRGINDFLQPNIGSTTNFPSPVTVCRLLPQDADTTNTAWGILGVFSSVTALQSSPAMPVLDSLTWAQHTNRLQMAEWQNVLLNIFWIGKIKQGRTTGKTCPTQAVACSSSWCLLAFSYIFSDFVF